MSHSFSLFIASLAGIIGIALANHAAIIKQLEDWQVLPKQQRLSELYFANEQHLPATARRGAEQRVTFTIHNIEYQTVTYHYALIAASGTDNTSQQLHDGTLTLKHDQFKTVSDVIKVPSISKRTAIKVELEYSGIAPDSRLPGVQKQSIAYWMRVIGL
jgi:glycogen synthase